MLDLGRKTEQSLLLITLLKVTLIDHHNEQVAYNLQQSVLMSNEGLVNYRYKYRKPIQLLLLLDLMLFDPNNPRSLTYQFYRLKILLQKLPSSRYGDELTEYERLILDADNLIKLTNKNDLTEVDVATDCYKMLDDLLSRMYELISTIPVVISKIYFKHERTPTTIIST